MTATTTSLQQFPAYQPSPILEHPSNLQDPWLRSLMSGKHRPNFLIHCPDMSVVAAASEVTGLCAGPLHVCVLPGYLRLPDETRGSHGTFVIGDISKLTLQQQITLSDWMTYRNRSTQVVSLTSVPLLPLVQDGRFLEGLFYRLNIVSVHAK
jgi:transcriptional regulator of aromatic amino acid metabolism